MTGMLAGFCSPAIFESDVVQAGGAAESIEC